VFVSVRALATALGIESVEWYPVAQIGTLASGDKQVTFKVGRKKMLVNDTPVVIDAAPLEREGRIYLPVRYVAEAFGWEVTSSADNVTLVGP